MNHESNNTSPDVLAISIENHPEKVFLKVSDYGLDRGNITVHLQGKSHTIPVRRGSCVTFFNVYVCLRIFYVCVFRYFFISLCLSLCLCLSLSSLSFMCVYVCVSSSSFVRVSHTSHTHTSHTHAHNLSL
mmetsp:Transcript_70140/g.113911  ORF Transcript_70140/g.113911 Transcript_70140/m.113911 type:complete len:130 (+) Transcript_70140:333-722(+)